MISELRSAVQLCTHNQAWLEKALEVDLLRGADHGDDPDDEKFKLYVMSWARVSAKAAAVMCPPELTEQERFALTSRRKGAGN